MIYVSTGGLKEKTTTESIRQLTEHGVFQLELSGGKYEANLVNQLKRLISALSLSIQVHNYFPPPEHSFVFNLASADIDIEDLSMKHAMRSILLANTLETYRYSFHAGFLIDPKPSELGKKINKYPLSDRRKGIDRFVNRVNTLSKYAKELGVTLLIENNVLSQDNYKHFGEDPLLMTGPSEASEIMNATEPNVKMLLDVAHLKVSANTLGFDPTDMFDKCHESIEAYHLSDNDGLEDQNNEVKKSSWFWPYLNKELDYYSLEVYTREYSKLLSQIDLTNNMLSS